MILIIYFDNAASTRMLEAVFEEMRPFLTEQYGNPSSQHTLGRIAKRAVSRARELVANGIGASPKEIAFTSGGTEADNLAIKGVCDQQLRNGRYKIVTTNIEHPAVLNTCKQLSNRGFQVTYLPVNSGGFITANHVMDAIDDKTAIVTVMLANNEIGTIQPVQEIGEICRDHDVPFHVDAVQAVGNLPINAHESNIDLMSISAHKIHGPKGIGALYIRDGMKCSPQIHGGGQEGEVRSGTENVASIVGFGKAMELATENIILKSSYIASLRDLFLSKIVDGDMVRLNGSRSNRLCGNANVSFKGMEGESIVLRLSAAGICASAKSACNGGSLEPSYVIKALGVDDAYLFGAVRFSFGEFNTKDEVEQVIETLKNIL